MTTPKWRGFGEEIPLRRFIRANCLHDGLCVEDLDVVLRRYWIHDQIGRLRLVEHKLGAAELGTSKAMTFGLIDALLRVADPDRRYYDGLYVLRTPVPSGRDLFDDISTIYKLGNKALTREQFIAWANFEGPDLTPRAPRPRFVELMADLRACHARPAAHDRKPA